MRPTLVAGNAKMHLDRASVRRLLTEVRASLDREPPRGQTAYCPPYTLLAEAASVLRGSTLELGAQDVHWEARGAFTGEISAPMLAEAGCRYVIVGHSERRRQFQETDPMIGAKARAAIGAGLIPILCVGETEAERASGRTESVLAEQVSRSLGEGTSVFTSDSLVLAYEPVWAIGTGISATPAQVRDAHAWVRTQLGKVVGVEAAARIRILYGGSVKPENAEELMRSPDVDGALVGGASLESRSFLDIVRAADAATGLAPGGGRER
jgi:triosephosphate isomerase (TIM)